MLRFAPVALLILATLPLDAAVLGTPAPITDPEYGEAGGASEHAVTAVNGDRMLVVWNRGEGAVRVGRDGRPLDIPALALPKPDWTSGADVVSDGDGWIVAWTTFAFEDGTSFLRLVRVSREGDVGIAEDIPLPQIVPQNADLHLASRGRVIAAAYQRDGGSVAVFTADDREPVAIGGTLRELVATAEGFALLLADRIVISSDDVVPLREIALPDELIATGIAEADGELVICGAVSTGIAVARSRTGTAAAEIVARIAASTNVPRLAVDGHEIALVWNAAQSDLGPYDARWDLYAARVHVDGEVDGPQRLRESVDLSGRWIAGPDAPRVERVDGAWIAVWSEGPRSPSASWRNLYATPLGPMQSVGEPALLTWRAVDQWLIGTALSRDVVLVVWREWSDFVTRAYAARFTIDGRRIDAEKILLDGDLPTTVRATNDGFLAFGGGRRFRFGLEGAPIREEDTPALADVACAGDTCLAAWTAEEASTGSVTLRVAAWNDGALGPELVVHASGQPYRGLALASDGERFLLTFARNGSPGGSIMAAASIARGDDHSWTVRVADYAFSTAFPYGFLLSWTGDRYVSLWTDAGSSRGAYLSKDGAAIDGGETGWKGWTLAPGGFMADVAYDGKRTLLLAEAWQKTIVFELRGRTLVPVAELDADHASIECSEARCTLIEQNEVFGDPWFRASRLFLQRFGFSRSRAIRH